MFTLDLDKLTPEQRAMVALWEEHMKAEFQDKDARASCDTMVANPYVNHVPVGRKILARDASSSSAHQQAYGRHRVGRG